jgi:hypothetical protein
MALPTVYISHSSQDNDFAERLANALQDDSRSVFFDRHVYDARYPARTTIDVISRCSVFVLVLSPATLQSMWARSEYAATYSWRNGQREQIAEVLALASRVIGDEQIQPFRFLESDWLRHIVVVLSQAVELTGLADDEWASLHTLDIVAGDELQPLPESDAIRTAQERVASSIGQTAALLNGVAGLPFLLADWMTRNGFDIHSPDDPNAKQIAIARRDMTRIFLQERQRLFSDFSYIQESTEVDVVKGDVWTGGPPAIWCPVANVAEEQQYGPGGHELRRGTKHFPPGAKVYCMPELWGDGYEDIMVVGRHRGSHRYVTMVIPSRRLTNWRADLVYSPHVMRELEGYWDGTAASKQRAQAIVDVCREREAKRSSETSE